MPGMFDPYHRWLGIPPKDQPANHYRLLGIDLFEPDPEVIRDLAQQRMAHVRTYQLGQYCELSQRILNELAAARACLLDPQKKAAYDEQLSKAPVPAPIDKPEEAENGFPPALPQIRPLTKQWTPRPMPRWLLPTAIGVVVVVGAAFMLTGNHKDKTPGNGKVLRNPPHLNTTVSADNATVTVNEADTAVNTGKYGHVGDDTVTIAASIGKVKRNDAKHTWNWSYTPHGPGKE